MIKFRIISILSMSLFLSCNGSKSHLSEVEDIVIHSENYSQPYFEDLFSQAKFIRLETNTKCELNAISKVLVVGEIYYVSDKNKIAVFNHQGEYQFSIEKRGRGPQEYNSISDFQVRGNHIIVLDRVGFSILFYDLAGRFEKKINMDIWASSFAIVDSVLMINADYEIEGKKFYPLNETNGTIGSGFYDVSKEQTNYMHFSGQENFSYSGNTVLFNEAMNEVISELKTDRIIPKYRITFDGCTPPTSFWNTEYKNVMDFMTAFKKNNYRCGAAFFMETDQKLLFSFGGSEDANFCLFDKESKTSLLFKEIKIDTNLLIPTQETIISNQYDGSAILIVPAENLFDENEELKTTRFKDLTINDNAILFQFNL